MDFSETLDHIQISVSDSLCRPNQTRPNPCLASCLHQQASHWSVAVANPPHRRRAKSREDPFVP
jgi:hypothetical protein